MDASPPLGGGHRTWPASVGAWAACLLVLFVAAQPAWTDDWPRWRGPHHNGIAHETGWLTQWPAGGPPVAWREPVGVGFASVAVAAGRIYTMGNEGDRDIVTCLDAATGRIRWRHTYDCPLDDKLFEGGPTATPTADGGRVYTLSRRGHLFCFDAAKGDIKWSVNVHEQTSIRIPSWGYSGSPLIHGDLLLLNVGESGVALHKKTGEVAWASDDKDGGYNTPVPYRRGERWCAAFANGREFLGVDIATGDVLWRHRWLTRYGVNAADAIVPAPGNADHVLISSGYNKGAALLELTASEDAQVVWQNKALRMQLNGGVLIDGRVYGFDGDAGDPAGLLKCIDMTTGDVLWEHKGLGVGSLMAADGNLIVLSDAGELLIAPASPDGFKPTARAKVIEGKCWTVPVLANGRIYCRNAQGDLVCVDVRMRASP